MPHLPRKTFGFLLDILTSSVRALEFSLCISVVALRWLTLLFSVIQIFAMYLEIGRLVPESQSLSYLSFHLL